MYEAQFINHLVVDIRWYSSRNIGMILKCFVLFLGLCSPAGAKFGIEQSKEKRHSFPSKWIAEAVEGVGQIISAFRTQIID